MPAATGASAEMAKWLRDVGSKFKGTRIRYVSERTPPTVVADMLATELIRRSAQGRRPTLLLKHDNEVTHGDVVKVQDAAKGARLEQILLVVPDKN